MEEPVAKRRKLSNDAGDVEITAAQTGDFQLSLASVMLSGLTTDAAAELLKAIANAGGAGSIEVDLKQAQYHEVDGQDVLTIRTTRAAKKSFTTFSVNVDRFSVEEQDILRDAALATTWTPRKREGLPLLSSRATLSIDQGQSGDYFKMQIDILWRNSPTCPERLALLPAEMLYKYLPPAAPISFRGESWSPRDFYDNVHIPEKIPELSADIKNDLLDCELYPFQRRAVRWLLEREGAVLGVDGRISEKQVDNNLPLSFEKTTLKDGRACFVSHALGIATTDIEAYKAMYPAVKGGILAEEMGLGKTVEMISVFCLHKRKMNGHAPVDANGLRESKATLIITPPSILEQWKQEIELHAPSLKVMHYVGIKGHKGDEKELLDDLVNHDVVLCTYNTLASEIHFSVPPPQRSFRHKKQHEPRKSPLIQISWWRVCLDEAQMIESGISNAAQVARLIPRINAWAVSGTPLRRDAKDIYGLLLFLRYEPWCLSQQIWDRLLSYFKSTFRKLLGGIAIRHNKDGVREDLRLPPQTRNVITVPFSAIEEQHYSQLVSEMCDDCQVDANGAPLTEDWDPYFPTIVEKMRAWLVRLRQTCLHPEVGGRNRRALGRSEGPLRTVEEVLNVMIDQNESNLRAEQRASLMLNIRRGQVHENAKMARESMAIYKKAYEDSKAIVDEVRASFNAEKEKEKVEKEKARVNNASKEESDSEDEDLEMNSKLGTWRQRLRAALETMHIAIFFMGNTFFQLKSNEEITKPESEEFEQLGKQEEDAYEEAKRIRTELLSEALAKANRLINQVRKRTQNKTFISIPRMQIDVAHGGIEHRKIFDKLDGMCEVLNKHTDQFNAWRTKMTDFLKSSLVDEEEIELKGDEYEESTKLQDQQYVYMEALRAMFADRSDAISGQENLLIAHEMKMARLSAKKDEGPDPKLFLSILDERERLKVPKELGSLRAIITETRALATSLQWQEGNGSTRATAELSIVNDILRQAQQMSTDQTKTIGALEREVELFRETMNQRLEYYRALQKISDTVAPWEEEKIGKPLDQATLDRTAREEDQREAKITKLLSQRRYLQHLKMESLSDGNQRICIICQSEFETGTLTVCGHQFCKDCIRLWWSEHKTCPMCKKHLSWPKDFHQISYKPRELMVREETSTAGPEDQSATNIDAATAMDHQSSIYSSISTSMLNQIKVIDLDGASYGTKIDTLVRHVLWLRRNDLGCKSVIFSQYREFLEVLGRALKQHRILFSSIDGKDGLERFKHDPAIECFFLHAKAQSSGINLVNASHVFLCEPLINTAIELQAIARIHRIGQRRPSKVWMYLVHGTVEESIYEISLERRLAHMKSKTASRSGAATPNLKEVSETAIDKANSLELQEADLSKLMTKGKHGGEQVDQQDLWECLFGNVKDKRANDALDLVAADAGSDMGRFLRAEAADSRQEEKF